MTAPGWDDVERQRALLEREPGGNSPDSYRMVTDLAYGDSDGAMTAPERGLATREPLFYIISILCDPLFDPLKKDQRFAARPR